MHTSPAQWAEGGGQNLPCCFVTFVCMTKLQPYYQKFPEYWHCSFAPETNPVRGERGVRGRPFWDLGTRARPPTLHEEARNHACAETSPSIRSGWNSHVGRNPNEITYTNFAACRSVKEFEDDGGGVVRFTHFTLKCVVAACQLVQRRWDTQRLVEKSS